MIPTMFSLEDAKDFFYTTPGGLCLCIKGKEVKEIDSYEDAVKFYNSDYDKRISDLVTQKLK